MRHDDFKKLIPFYFYGELTQEESQSLQQHLEACAACRRQFEEVQGLHSALNKKTAFEPSEELLTGLRLQLRERLRGEVRTPWWQRLSISVLPKRVGWQLAGVVASLLLGLFIGRWVWTDQETTARSRLEVLEPYESYSPSRPLISNIDLIEYDPQTGMVTVRYKSINDVVLRGRAEDEPIRQVLARAIRSEIHPGRRLTAVKAFDTAMLVDAEIEAALIYALEKDTVEGVRLCAAKVLKALPLTENIKKAFIRVLLKDPNPAVRMAAVEALSLAQTEVDVLPVLQDAARDDENEFIRLKTAQALRRLENPPVQ